MKEESITVITLNCQRGHRISDLHVYLDGLLRQGAVDIFLLQEVSNLVFHSIKEILKRSLNYQVIRPINPKTQKPTEVAIIYKLGYKLMKSEYISYSDFVIKKKNEVGALIGQFQHPNQGDITVCSSHLHASYMFRVRKKEIQYIKEALLRYNSKTIVLGGDFNYIFPGELKRGNSILQQEFIHVSTYTEHSADSALLEPTEFQNKLFKLLAKIGLRFLLKLDHVYLYNKLNSQFTTASSIQSVVVSDHRPVLVSITKS